MRRRFSKQKISNIANTEFYHKYYSAEAHTSLPLLFEKQKGWGYEWCYDEISLCIIGFAKTVCMQDVCTSTK